MFLQNLNGGGVGKMVIENTVLKLLKYSAPKPKLEITWENGKTSICEIDTFYDSDNGLELDDVNYKEYHVALVIDVSNNYQYVEIDTGENKPKLIKLVDTREIIFKSDKFSCNQKRINIITKLRYSN